MSNESGVKNVAFDKFLYFPSVHHMWRPKTQVFHGIKRLLYKPNLTLNEPVHTKSVPAKNTS